MIRNRLVKAMRILRDHGPVRLTKESAAFLYYRGIRPRLPRRTAVYNGYRVREPRLFDSILSQQTFHRPNYESGLLDGLSKHVNEGDRVVIVGGGVGVTAVAAAEQVGDSGEVVVFEAAADQLPYIRDTASLNDVSDRITVHHAVVGPEISLRGAAAGAERISAEELPPCDVLELDCEGAEKVILDRLSFRPRVLLVETHGMLGAPKSVITEMLQAIGYEVVSTRVADKDVRALCVENDVYVLAGIREQSVTPDEPT